MKRLIHIWKCECGQEIPTRKKESPKLCPGCKRKDTAKVLLKSELAPKKARSQKQKLESKADVDWGLAIRRRDKICRLCKRVPTANAHHIVKRGNKITRLLLKNGIGLCFRCHAFVEAKYTMDWANTFGGISEYAECMISLIGIELWDELQAILKTKRFKYDEQFIAAAHDNIKLFLGGNIEPETLLTHEE